MTILRDHLLERRWLTVCLIGLALLIRAAVPAGYMPVISGGAITIALCSGSVPMPMPMSGMGDHHDKPSDDGKGEMPCGFSGLFAPSLGGADAVVLATAIAFIVASVFRAAGRPPIALPRFLRPPLRGPPATV